MFLTLEQVGLLIAHGLPWKLRAGGGKVARCFPFMMLFLSSGVSWYLRKHSLYQESNACQGLQAMTYLGLQAMTYLGWIEAATSWSLPRHPEKKYSSERYYWIIGSVFKIHNRYSLGKWVSYYQHDSIEKEKTSLNNWFEKRRGLRKMTAWICPAHGAPRPHWEVVFSLQYLRFG